MHVRTYIRTHVIRMYGCRTYVRNFKPERHEEEQEEDEEEEGDEEEGKEEEGEGK